MKVALIGMPTSGKSTISNLIADYLDYSLIDLDRLLEKKFNMSLQNFINLEGEKEFLKQENALMKSINYPENCIISTGGSVVYATEAMNKMQESNIHFIYLKVPIETLNNRLSNQRDMRGIIMNGLDTWEDLLASRDYLYEKYADSIVDTENKTAYEIYFEIKNSIIQEN